MKEKEDSIDSEEYKLWISLTQLRRTIVQSRDKLIDRQLIPPAQGAALYYIHTCSEGTTITILSSVMSLNHSSVSELVDRMENKGWIKRIKDVRDARQTRITLTREGKEVCHQGAQSEYICEIISILTKKQREQFKSMLDRLKEKASKTSI
jgi:MarR family transcriptional regulator, organic hydroperoxide resistance regulator